MIVLKGHRHRVERVAFSPDGEGLFAPTWQGIQVWRPFLSPSVPAVLPIRHAHELRLTPDGSTLYVAGYGLRCINLASGVTTELMGGGTSSRFALAHGGDRFIADRLRIGADPVVFARTHTGEDLWSRAVSAPDWWGNPLFLPGDGEFIRLKREGQGRGDQKFRIVAHETTTGNEVRESNPLAAEVREWLISPDGSLVACWYTVWVHVYPLHEPFTKPLATLRNDNRKEFTGIAFHPSGRFLAATSNDATVKLYDTTTWEVARTFTWDIGRMRSIAFSPDGNLAAAGSDTGKVVVWDVDI